jgi:release factor glutamine methyltransferase
VNSIAALLAAARARIVAAEARLLMRHLLGRDAAWLVAHDDIALTTEQAEKYAGLVARRAQGEPIAYLLGEREFYGRSFRVTPEVLIPRPETELLVELGVAKLNGTEAPKILELGTGSGCIAISLALELPGTRVTAIDISQNALTVARSNAARHGAAIDFLQGDWLSGVTDHYALIVSNPPYVAAGDPHLRAGDLRFEPAGALASGDDGLDAIRSIAAAVGSCLVPDGWLMLEHGYDQAEAVGQLLADSGFCSIASHSDLGDIARVTVGQWPRSLDAEFAQRIN